MFDSTLLMVFSIFLRSRHYNGLLDYLIGKPAATSAWRSRDPMEGAKSIVLLIYGAMLGGLSLLVFPKPIFPWFNSNSLFRSSCWLFLLLAILVDCWARFRAVRGLPPLAHSTNTMNGFVFIIPFVMVRFLALR